MIETRKVEVRVDVTEVRFGGEWFPSAMVWEVLQALQSATEDDPVMVEHRPFHLTLDRLGVIHTAVRGAALVHWPAEGFEAFKTQLGAYYRSPGRWAFRYLEWHAEVMAEGARRA